jgi:hypothetical protein
LEKKIVHFKGLNALNVQTRTLDLHQILRMETLQIMKLFKAVFVDPNYCVSLVVFQRYINIVSSNVHPLGGSFDCVFILSNFSKC